MTYADIKFEVATSNGLGGDTFIGKCDGLTDGWTTDRLWYEISKEKSRYMYIIRLNVISLSFQYFLE